MLIGIGIQLISMTIFCGLWLYFLYAARREGVSRVLAWTVTFSAACIMVRNVYRAVELGQGFDGYLSYHEAFFSVLDASFMVLAVVVFCVWWPAGYLVGRGEYEGGVERMPRVERYEEIGMKGRASSDEGPLVR